MSGASSTLSRADEGERHTHDVKQHHAVEAPVGHLMSPLPGAWLAAECGRLNSRLEEAGENATVQTPSRNLPGVGPGELFERRLFALQVVVDPLA